MDALNYYTLERCQQIFNSVKNSKWRVWKVVDEDELVYQNEFQISSPKRLFNFIHQYPHPQALYVGISEFLNPHKHHGFFWNQKTTYPDGSYYYPRAGYLIADCILLDSYFFVDIDDENDMGIVQEDGRKIIRYMENKLEFNLKEIRFSGTKGIHLEFERSKKLEIINPIDRIKGYQAQNQRIAKELLKLDLKTMDKYHVNVMTDVFRVAAAPYSLKMKSSGIVQPIALNDFMTKDIRNIIPLTSEAKAYENAVAMRGRNALQPSNIVDRGRAGLSTYPHYFGIVANFVPGLKNNYVPFIKMHKSRRVDLNDIKEDLGDLLIFGEENYYWLIGYKLFQKEKLLKVMRKLKASNCMEFQKRYAKFRFTNILDKDRDPIAPPPKLLHKIKSKKVYTYSLAHKNFFKEFDEQEKMYGQPTLKTYEAISRP